MAENIDVNVNVNTSQANRNLDNLNNRIGKLNQTFGALKSAIAGIAFGSIINNALNFSAAMVDVSNSTDIALESVVGFSRAVQDNGGDINSAQQALQKFNVTIGEAAQGSAIVQEAFERIGVSLDDLGRLSQEDLLRKTIQGLSQIEDASTRARLASQLLGKSFSAIDIRGLAGDFDNAVRNSIAYTEAIRTADQVQGNLEKAITDLQIALLAVLQPVGDLAKSISTNVDAIVKWTKVIFEFVKVIATFFIIGKVVQIFYRLYQGIKLLIQSFSILGALGKDLGSIFRLLFRNDLVEKITKLAEKGGKAGQVALAIGAALSKIATAAGNAAMAIAGFIAGIIGLEAAAEKYKSLQEDFSKPLIIEGSGAQAMPEGFFEKRREQIRQIEIALRKEQQAIKEVTAAYQRANAEQIANINIQRLSLDMSRDEVDVINAVDEVIRRNEESIRKLREQKEGLASDSKLITTINEEIAKLEQSLETDKRVTAEAVRNLQQRQLEQEKLNKQLEVTAQKLQDAQSLTNLNAQLAVIGQYGDELENNLLILQITEELQGKLTALAIKQIELENQRIQLGETRFQQELEHLNALREAAYEYAGARLEAEQKILEAQRATREDARAGVEQAMDDIAKQFEPYQQAQDAVRQGWNRISGAIDEFIETGKFNFKDFARSVLADLAKMIAKALVFKAIQSALGMFGLSLPGLANGGPAKQNQPYIVGEKGPELFVPRTSGTVVPNNKLASMEGTGQLNAPITNNYITNNINAVDAKSVAQLFAENRKTLLGAVATAQREMPYMA